MDRCLLGAWRLLPQAVPPDRGDGSPNPKSQDAPEGPFVQGTPQMARRLVMWLLSRGDPPGQGRWPKLEIKGTRASPARGPVCGQLRCVRAMQGGAVGAACWGRGHKRRHAPITLRPGGHREVMPHTCSQ